MEKIELAHRIADDHNRLADILSSGGMKLLNTDSVILMGDIIRDLRAITQERMGASAVILSPIAGTERPRYRGLEAVCAEKNTYLRIFGKPTTRVNRRMGVVVRYAPNGSDLDELRDRTKAAAALVEVY